MVKFNNDPVKDANYDLVAKEIKPDDTAQKKGDTFKNVRVNFEESKIVIHGGDLPAEKMAERDNRYV